MRLFHTLVIFMAAGALLSAVVRADTIPPNPFVSRLESPGPMEPAISEVQAAAEYTAVATETDLEVVGIVSSGQVIVLILRQGADRLLNVAVGEQINDTLTLVEVGDSHATLRRVEDDTLVQLELPGVNDE